MIQSAYENAEARMFRDLFEPEWRKEEEDLLFQMVCCAPENDWEAIKEHFPDKTVEQLQERWYHALDPRGTLFHWSPEEDQYLKDLVMNNRDASWHAVAEYFPGKKAKDVKARWMDYICTDRAMEEFTHDEDKAIEEGFAKYGSKWSLIAHAVPGRSENAIKARWDTVLSNGSEQPQLFQYISPQCSEQNEEPSDEPQTSKNSEWALLEPSSDSFDLDFPSLMADPSGLDFYDTF